MVENNYSIHDLINLSGIPRRTIHFYLQQGLLPPPEGNGPAARYGPRHLLQLRLIPWLRENGNRLDEIRNIFNRSTGEDFIELENRMNVSPLNAPAERFSSSRCAVYTFAPGVELLVHEDISHSIRKQVDELLHVARQLFLQNNGGKNANDGSGN